ncbi:uncharacterized protein LOC144665715 [Oculina patagonica]
MDEEEAIPSKIPRLEVEDEHWIRPPAVTYAHPDTLHYAGKTSSCVGEITEQCNGSSMYTSDNPLKVTIVAAQWHFSLFDSSFLSRELAIQLAKFSQVQVTYLVPETLWFENYKREAASYGVTIVEAKKQPGFDDPVEWLNFPPQNLANDIVVGVGERFGKIAQIFKERHQCKSIYVASDSFEDWFTDLECLEELRLACNKRFGLTIGGNVGLSEMADLPVTIGPKTSDEFSRRCRNKDIFPLTPGILEQFSDVKHATTDGTKFRILIFGGSNPDNFEQEGLNTAAEAVAKLNDKAYHLVYVGAAKGKHGQFVKKFLQCGIAKTQLTFRSLPSSEEDLKRLFCEVDLAIMPSGEQGFGMMALAALSAGLPILVHGDSGFGEALREVKFGSSSTVDSEDAKAWAKAIKKLRKLDRKTRLEEAAILRSSYDEKYSWEKQFEELVKLMLSLASAQPDHT